MSNLSSLKFQNPAYVRVWTYVGDPRVLAKIAPDSAEIELSDGLRARWRFQDDIDSAILQLWITGKKRRWGFSIERLSSAADSVEVPNTPDGVERFQVRDYLLSDRDLSDFVSYADRLLYDVCFKKESELGILYSPVADNEFLVPFFKHLVYLDLAYAKIERFYRKFKTEVYPGIRTTHSELIATCSGILDARRKKWNELDAKTLSGWSLAVDELNFGLRYDKESVESNLANLKSRIRSLGAEGLRYFQNHVEKAEFVLNAFDKAADKNALIKETILKNGIEYVAARREEEKLANESAKIRHLKNIKELVGGLAFVEIFTNAIAESIKVSGWTGKMAEVLSNTSIMRAGLILLAAMGYFIHYFYQVWREYRIKKKELASRCASKKID